MEASRMENDGLEFVIENGVLKRYNGQGGDVIVPDGVKAIGGSAFSRCENVRSITIPNSVTEIGQSAFTDCNNLTSVVIPDSVHTVGMFAFSYCAKLKKVFIPKSILNVGMNVFDESKEATVYCEAVGEYYAWHEDWDGDWENGFVKVVWGATKADFDKA